MRCAIAVYRWVSVVRSLEGMANGVWHTGYEIFVHLTHADLGHRDRPGLLEEITKPVGERNRQLLECLEHHKEGVCQAEGEGRTPWMTIRRRTIDGVTTRGAPAAAYDGDCGGIGQAQGDEGTHSSNRPGARLGGQVGGRAGDGRIRTDVLVAGPAGKVGWEAQYSPITAATVRSRSRRAVERGITPLWVTCDGSSALIDRAPWVLVDDQPWHVIASRKSMLVRAGARYLQEWRCDEHRQRPCPGSGGMRGCGGFHVHRDLPALCLRQGGGVEAPCRAGVPSVWYEAAGEVELGGGHRAGPVGGGEDRGVGHVVVARALGQERPLIGPVLLTGCGRAG